MPSRPLVDPELAPLIEQMPGFQLSNEMLAPTRQMMGEMMKMNSRGVCDIDKFTRHGRTCNFTDRRRHLRKEARSEEEEAEESCAREPSPAWTRRLPHPDSDQQTLHGERSSRCYRSVTEPSGLTEIRMVEKPALLCRALRNLATRSGAG